MAVLLPIAGIVDWIEGILPLLFLLFWIVSQVRALFGGAGRDKPARPVVVRQAPRPPAGDDEAHRELARQIEEFVRRSGGERPRSQVAPSATERRRRDAGTAQPAPSRSRATTVRPPAQAAASAPLTQQHPAQLGTLGGHAGDVARHVEGAFAHEIDHLPEGLARGEAARAATRVAAAAGIMAALRDPRTLRQLMIVREVLDRPVDRW